MKKILIVFLLIFATLYTLYGDEIDENFDQLHDKIERRLRSLTEGDRESFIQKLLENNENFDILEILHKRLQTNSQSTEILVK